MGKGKDIERKFWCVLVHKLQVLGKLVVDQLLDKAWSKQTFQILHEIKTSSGKINAQINVCLSCVSTKQQEEYLHHPRKEQLSQRCTWTLHACHEQPKRVFLRHVEKK